ncbi:protein rolling stone-like isoform X2 [Ptychodera flava]
MNAEVKSRPTGTCVCRLSKSDFGFEGEVASKFAFSEWRCIPPMIFLVYRTVVAVYMLFWAVYFIPEAIDYNKEQFLLFFSNIGFLLLAVYLVIACVTSWHYFVILEIQVSRGMRGNRSAEDASSETNTRLLWYFKLLWFLYPIVSGSALVVTIVYWGALYRESEFPSVIDFHIHAMNSVIILIDISINAIPVRFAHCIYSLLFSALYVIMTVIFWAADGHNYYDGGNYLYTILDYGGSPIPSAIAVCGIFVAVVVLYALLFGVYKMKICIHGGDEPPDTSRQEANSSVAV